MYNKVLCWKFGLLDDRVDMLIWSCWILGMNVVLLLCDILRFCGYRFLLCGIWCFLDIWKYRCFLKYWEFGIVYGDCIFWKFYCINVSGIVE